MRQITLTQGFIAFVDDEDYERINQYKWFAVVTVTGPNGFHVAACRWSPGSYPERYMIYMHHEVLYIDREILNGWKILGKLIDHDNRNACDNQKVNLKESNKSLNAYNSERSTKAKGIYYEPSRNRYKAFLLRPKRKYVGTYKTYEEAKQARDALL